LRDVQTEIPEKGEFALLDPARLSAPKGKKQTVPEPVLWQRTLLGLEGTLGPVSLDLGNGRSLLVSGNVDRIERWVSDDLSFIRVVDYKTSKESYLKAYAEDDAPFTSHLQTPLYMLLAEKVYLGERATAVLLPLRDEDPKPFTKHLITLADEGPDQAWRERLLMNIARFDARLEVGDFPPIPGEHCSQCQLAALCGRPVDVTVETDGEGD
jgi:RecB family exonuclease